MMEKVIDRWETLVNPQKEIPPAIFALTGITNNG
jgi:DNA polymerase-3 subunit epsilon